MPTLMVMTSDFKLLGELPLYTSLQLTRSHYGIGDFELHTHPSAPCASEIAQGVLLFPSDAPHKCLLIEDVVRNHKEIVTKGCQLKGWARRRICVPPLSLPTSLWRYSGGAWVQITDAAMIREVMVGDVYQGYAYPESPEEGMCYLDLSSQAALYDWSAGAEQGAVWLDLQTAQLRSKYQNFGWDRYTGPAESALKHYALNNMIAPEDPARSFPDLICAADQGRGASLPWQSRFDKLDDHLSNIGDTTGMGWDIRPDFTAKKYIFETYPGRNLSTGSRLAVISTQMGNAADVETTQTATGSATTAYVGGVGEDENRTILAVGNEAAGLDRRETWVDGGSLDDPEMINMLGLKKLQDMASGATMKVTMIDTGACRYERDWDLGDKVLVKGDNSTMAARIISVKEIYEVDKPRGLEVTFGAAPVTLGKVIRRLDQQTVR